MPTEDLRFYDGTSWQSLSALAAEQVEPELPIKDADGSVQIWSAANEYINFDTGGTSDFKMDPSGNLTANGKYISKATGLTDVSFCSASGNDGFAIVADGIPGIVAATQQIQNWSYTADVGGYSRYQAMMKARGGDESYSELLFLSDAAANEGLRFIACGKDVTKVAGWPLQIEAAGISSGGASALIHKGYQITGTSPVEYTPLVIGTDTRSDFVLMCYQAQALVFDAMKNEAMFLYDLRADSIQGTIDTDAQILLGDQATLLPGGGGTYEPSEPKSLVTKSYCDDKIWVGTQSQYDSLPEKNPKTLYCITD